MKKISESLNTGDINLAAALMSMGVPLIDGDPCTLVLRDNGGSYARFHLGKVSIDGAKNTEALMRYWKQPANCPDLDFLDVMGFVKRGIKEGAKLTDEWFDLAQTYIREISGGVVITPKRLELIPDYVKANPNSHQSYLLAFVYNRNECWEIIKHSKRQLMISRGESHAMIDTTLAAWKRDEILARLED